MNWKHENYNGRQTWKRPANIGRGVLSGNGFTLEQAHHYNGSGDDAFGGAEEWPHLKLNLGFEEGQEIEAAAFAEKLMEFIDHELPLRKSKLSN